MQQTLIFWGGDFDIDLVEFVFWNIKDLRHQIAEIYGYKIRVSVSFDCGKKWSQIDS